MSAFLQSLAVAMVVLACLWQVLQRCAPRLVWRVQARVAVSLELGGQPWLRAVGLRLRPREVATGGGCGSGCNTCGGCATPGTTATR